MYLEIAHTMETQQLIDLIKARCNAWKNRNSVIDWRIYYVSDNDADDVVKCAVEFLGDHLGDSKRVVTLPIGGGDIAVVIHTNPNLSNGELHFVCHFLNNYEDELYWQDLTSYTHILSEAVVCGFVTVPELQTATDAGGMLLMEVVIKKRLAEVSGIENPSWTIPNNLAVS